MDELDAKGEREKNQGKMLCHCHPTQPNFDKLKSNFYDLVTLNLLAKWNPSSTSSKLGANEEEEAWGDEEG